MVGMVVVGTAAVMARGMRVGVRRVKVMGQKGRVRSRNSGGKVKLRV